MLAISSSFSLFHSLTEFSFIILFVLAITAVMIDTIYIGPMKNALRIINIEKK